MFNRTVRSYLSRRDDGGADFYPYGLGFRGFIVCDSAQVEKIRASIRRLLVLSTFGMWLLLVVPWLAFVLHLYFVGPTEQISRAFDFVLKGVVALFGISAIAFPIAWLTTIRSLTRNLERTAARLTLRTWSKSAAAAYTRPQLFAGAAIGTLVAGVALGVAVGNAASGGPVLKTLLWIGVAFLGLAEYFACRYAMRESGSQQTTAHNAR